MQTITADELKQIEVQMLADIHNWCESNGIAYWLAYGTALGAVRHGGFIPWDDDIDIYMLREQYDKFIKEYPQGLNDIRVISEENDDAYPYTFAKIINVKTQLFEDEVPNAELGVYIDIFPMDNVGDTQKEVSRIAKKMWMLQELHWLSISRQLNRRHGGFIKRIVKFFAKSYAKMRGYKYWKKKIFKLATKRMNEQTLFIGRLVSGTEKTHVYSRDMFSPLNRILIDFEDRQFYIMKDYSCYLTTEYGDYLTLPTKEQQVSHHSFTANWR